MSETLKTTKDSYKNVLSDKVEIKEEGGFFRSINKAFTNASDYVKAKTGEELYYNDAQIEALKKALDKNNSLEQLEYMTTFGNYKGYLRFNLLDKEKKESVIKEEIEDYNSADQLDPVDRLKVGIYGSAIISMCTKLISDQNLIKKLNLTLRKNDKTVDFAVTDKLYNYMYDYFLRKVSDKLESNEDALLFAEDFFYYKSGFKRIFPNAYFGVVKEDNSNIVFLSSDKFEVREMYNKGEQPATLDGIIDEFIVSSLVDLSGKTVRENIEALAKGFESFSKKTGLKIDDIAFKFSQEDFDNEKNAPEKEGEALLKRNIPSRSSKELKDTLSDAEYHELLKTVKGHILSKFDELIYENKYVIKFEDTFDLSNNLVFKIVFDFEAIDKNKADEDDKHDNPYKKGKSSNVLYYIGKHLLSADFSNFKEGESLKFNGKVSGFNVSWDMSLFPLVSDDPSVNEAIMNAQDAIDERKSKLAFLYGKKLPETKTEGSDETFVDSNKIISNINKFIKGANDLHKKIKDTATTKMTLDVKELEIVKQVSNSDSSTDVSKQATQDDNASKNTDNKNTKNGGNKKKPKKESLFIENVLNDLCLFTEDNSSLSDLPQGDESKAKESQSAANDLKQDINTFIKGIDRFDGYFFSVILKGYIETGLDYVNKLNFLNTSLEKKSKLVKSEFDQSKKGNMARSKFADQMVRLEEIQNKYYREINSTYRSEVGEMLNKVSSSAEAIITLASSINAGQKKINTILKSKADSEISPENKELCEAWKKSLLAILAREDCVRAGLLPNPETQGNKYVFDKDLTFRYMKTNKTYTYNFHLEVVKEA